MKLDNHNIKSGNDGGKSIEAVFTFSAINYLLNRLH